MEDETHNSVLTDRFTRHLIVAMYQKSIEQSSEVRHFRARADSFFAAARDLSELEPTEEASGTHSYRPAVGLLAVHCCIALADAVLVATEGERGKGQDHAEAARRLDSLCTVHKIDRRGLKHFKWLLRNKNRFAYDNSRVEPAEFVDAKIKMEQFYAWVYEQFPKLAEGADDA